MAGALEGPLAPECYWGAGPGACATAGWAEQRSGPQKPCYTPAPATVPHAFQLRCPPAPPRPPRCTPAAQPVKSFKLRGAYNKMAQLSPEQLARGVICSSAGNHAQGVALGARTLVRCTGGPVGRRGGGCLLGLCSPLELQLPVCLSGWLAGAHSVCLLEVCVLKARSRRAVGRPSSCPLTAPL